MIYSVWNQARAGYDYFEDGVPDARANSPAPRHLKSSGTLGLAPDEASWPLPMGARPAGSGPTPKGRIARRGGGGGLGGLGGFEVSTPLIGLALLWGAVFYLWRRP